MKGKIKRFTAVILSVILSVGTVNTFALSETPDTDILTDFASELIYSNEGSYTSVNANDCGALSIGKVQWHASRALGLLKDIIALNKENAKKILGNKLYTEITTTQSTWNSRTLSKTEADAVSELLGTPEGRLAQDRLAKKDISGYIVHAKQLGITDGRTLVYFADIENQGGYGTAERIAAEAAKRAKSYSLITLDLFHSVSLEYMSGYSRRMSTYAYCKNLVFNDHSKNGIYGVNITDITGESCNINFKTDKEVTQCSIVLWDSTERHFAQYTLTPSDSQLCVEFTVKDAGITVNNGKITFSGKIMAFKKGQEEPYAIYENLNFTLESSQKPEYKIKGDVNGDGSVTVKDARLLLRYCAKLEDFNAGQKQFADVNGDEKISVSDAKLILRAVAGLASIK